MARTWRTSTRGACRSRRPSRSLRGCRGVRSQPRTGSPTPRRRQISATTHARRPPKAGRWGSTCPSTIDAASRRSRRRRRRALRRRPRWRCLWKRAARGTTERDARTRNSPSKTRRAASETMREARASSRRIPPRASHLRTTWRDLMWRRTGRVVPRPTDCRHSCRPEGWLRFERKRARENISSQNRSLKSINVRPFIERT